MATTVEDGGITVCKSYDPDGLAVPTVKYELRSERDERVTVRIADRLPASLTVEDVGFHPAFGKDRWRIDDGTIVYERELAPGAVDRTLYGLQREDVAIEALVEPTVAVEPADPEAGTVDEPVATTPGDGGPAGIDGGADREGATGAGGRDGEPGADGGDANGEGPTLALSDPGESAAVDDAAAAGGPAGPALELPAEGGERPSDEGPAIGQLDGDGLAAELARELREEAVSGEVQRALREELGLRLSRSTTAFVEHVEERARVKRERLAEEIERLEASVDELYGLTADAGEVERLKTGLTRLDERKAATARVQELADAIEELEAAKADRAALDDALAELSALEERTASADAVAELDGALAELERASARVERVAAVESELEELRAWAASAESVAALESELRGLEERAAADETVAELADRTDALEADRATREELAELTETVGERATEARVEHLEHELAALRESAANDKRVESLADEVAGLTRRKAETEDLAAVERRLSAASVTHEDVDDEITRRVDAGLRSTMLRTGGVAALLTGVALGALGQALAVPALLLGVGLLGGWWYTAR